MIFWVDLDSQLRTVILLQKEAVRKRRIDATTLCIPRNFEDGVEVPEIFDEEPMSARS